MIVAMHMSQVVDATLLLLYAAQAMLIAHHLVNCGSLLDR
jgi:hypothetical protein